MATKVSDNGKGGERTCEPTPDNEDVRRRSLLSRTNHILWHTQSKVGSFDAKKFHSMKVVCHLHEIKQVDTVHGEAEGPGVNSTWMSVLVQPATLLLPAPAKLALVFALPCSPVLGWKPEIFAGLVS